MAWTNGDPPQHPRDALSPGNTPLGGYPLATARGHRPATRVPVDALQPGFRGFGGQYPTSRADSP